MKRVMSVVMAVILTISLLPLSAAGEDFTGMTATEIVDLMGVGWNLGNTFDATGGTREDIYSQEQSWGNPIVDASLIQRVKEAGFKSIRIPVTWYRHTDSDYTINPAFLARVREVIDYCYAQDLIVIINMHHEEWLNHKDLANDQVKIGEQLAAMWRQIADYFADYDQRLIFEAMNEPRMKDTRVEWTGNKDGFDAVNYLNQVFVDTIRTNPKGNNAERCLMVPGYAASSSRQAMSAITFPTVNGEVVNNLIISVHGYVPYDFCLSDNWADFDPTNKSHTSGIDSMFSNMQKLFIDKGIPVVLGETGATNTNNNLEARERWAYYIGAKAAAYGIPTLIWDNGNNQSSGGECHAWVRRKLHEKLRSQKTPYIIPTVIEQLMAGANSVAWGSGREMPVMPKSMLNGTVMWADASGVKIGTNRKITFPSRLEWFAQGRQYAVAYTGTSPVHLVLMLRDQTEVTLTAKMTNPLGVKTIAWFPYDDVMQALAGHTSEEIVSIRAEANNVTIYEISYVGK